MQNILITNFCLGLIFKILYVTVFISNHDIYSLSFPYENMISKDEICKIVEELNAKVKALEEGVYICTDIMASQKNDTKWVDVSIGKICRDQRASNEAKKQNEHMKKYSPY